MYSVHQIVEKDDGAKGSLRICVFFRFEKLKQTFGLAGMGI